jgi:hypothetical protein
MYSSKWAGLSGNFHEEDFFVREVWFQLCSAAASAPNCVASLKIGESVIGGCCVYVISLHKQVMMTSGTPEVSHDPDHPAAFGRKTVNKEIPHQHTQPHTQTRKSNGLQQSGLSWSVSLL